MTFVDGERRLDRGCPRPPAHPRPVTPAVGALLDNACRSRRMVCRARERIGFADAHAVAARDEELLAHTGTDGGTEQLPHARAAEHSHRPRPGVPEVRVAHDADTERI